MKKELKVLLVILLQSIGSYSQSIIAVQNGGLPTLYSDLHDAFVGAQPGDTLYVPGGQFSINESINKELHIIGVGFHPDSTSATGSTIFLHEANNSPIIKLKTGASNGSITGVYFASPTQYSTSNIRLDNDIDNYSISRCFVSTGVYRISGADVSNFIITQSFLGRSKIYGSCLISNCLFFEYHNEFIGCVLKNNVFMKTNISVSIRTKLINCIVENNISIDNTFGTLINCSFYNNLMSRDVNGSDSDGNTGANNYIEGVAFENIFTNYNYSNLMYSEFKLITGSPYQSAGKDGTELGIYGGVFDWKEGAVPFNPHIQISQISSTTNAVGSLPIVVKVSAQDN